MIIDKSLSTYCDKSREYAVNNALDRCLFEMKIHDDLFDGKKYSFIEFEKDIHCPYCYSKKELRKIYKIAKITFKISKKSNRED